jgi:hypothetical protein
MIVSEVDEISEKELRMMNIRMSNKIKDITNKCLNEHKESSNS